jgi:hypothetical protein
MPRTLRRRQRIAIADHQISSLGVEGLSGVYLVLYADSVDRRPTVDMGFYAYNPRRQRHRGARRGGIVLNGLGEAMRAAEGLLSLIEQARALGLKDPDGPLIIPGSRNYDPDNPREAWTLPPKRITGR